jgi:hypothetical protein
VDDTDLQLPVRANEVLFFFVTIMYIAAATPDIKFKFDVPAAASMLWCVSDENIVTQYTEASVKSLGGQTSSRITQLYGILTVGANAGDFKLQWAQNTAHSSNTQVLKNSSLVAISKV